MKKAAIIIMSIIVVLCASCSKNAGASLFADGFYEILDENGNFKPPDGLEWGLSPKQAADFHGLRLTEDNWMITSQDTGRTIIATLDYNTAIFENNGKCIYYFWDDKLYLCWYMFHFDKENAVEALDFAKKLEKLALDALGDDEHFNESFLQNFDTAGDVFAMRQYRLRWLNEPDDETVNAINIEMQVDDNDGIYHDQFEELKKNRTPEDVIINIKITHNSPSVCD